MNYTALLDVYSLEEILEYNDYSSEDAVKFLVDANFIKLPEIIPIDFED